MLDFLKINDSKREKSCPPPSDLIIFDQGFQSNYVKTSAISLNVIFDQDHFLDHRLKVFSLVFISQKYMKGKVHNVC